MCVEVGGCSAIVIRGRRGEAGRQGDREGMREGVEVVKEGEAFPSMMKGTGRTCDQPFMFMLTDSYL